ncbi:HesA/MoeB/ThiF family protein [Flagellimonas sp. 389]|uniref:HesA/MoeB/ThiF family protein n=1 Tax=Flagellimonas sp. 389 TaxID=2835862 RepID=UPI001BD2BF3D|nr:HesA/MoeB/ThiF family protein [Flagellimonas sp. 389]MBS9463542.1 HesA/MoeB/ThiF family protein [Flagellimonas sp. 389]
MEDRYSRQTSLKEFGPEGQSKLINSKVLVVGLGGLGIPVLQYLNAMGVGMLGLLDQDVVELHNLQRQVLYTEKDLGRLKLEVTHEKLSVQNSQTVFGLHDTFLTKDNALDTIKDYDVVVDATDNFPTRYLINDACVILNKPFVYGALHGFEGHVSVFNHENGPTYRCLYPDMPTPDEVPNCNENGVMGVLPGIIGTLQALETIKLISGVGEVLSGSLLVYDGLSQRTTKMKFKLQLSNTKITELRETYQTDRCEIVAEVSVETFLELRESKTPFTLLDVRTKGEFDCGHLQEAIHLPLDMLQLPKQLSKSHHDIYIVCQSGKRSAIATRQLQMDYPELKFYNILGGMNKLMTLSS